MRTEARKQFGVVLLDHMQAFGRSETAMADPISSDDVLWRSGAAIPAASEPGEELGYLTHHRIFACLSGSCTGLPVRKALVPSRPIEKNVRRNR